ncbi:hypothetical protein Tco_0699949 [Tanacetum coccineum]
MTMHEVVHEMVVGEYYEQNSEGSGSAWKAYINARVVGLFLLVLLEYLNNKGVVRATSRDSIWHYTGLGYNVVPPPYKGKCMPPKRDLSFYGLEEFVNEPIVSEPTVKKPVVETSEAKSSADKPKVIRKNFGPPLIED